MVCVLRPRPWNAERRCRLASEKRILVCPRGRVQGCREGSCKKTLLKWSGSTPAGIGEDGREVRAGGLGRARSSTRAHPSAEVGFQQVNSSHRASNQRERSIGPALDRASVARSNELTGGPIKTIRPKT